MRLNRFKQTKTVEPVVGINSLEEYRSSGNKSVRLCRAMIISFTRLSFFSM